MRTQHVPWLWHPDKCVVLGLNPNHVLTSPFPQVTTYLPFSSATLCSHTQCRSLWVNSSSTWGGKRNRNSPQTYAPSLTRKEPLVCLACLLGYLPINWTPVNNTLCSSSFTSCLSNIWEVIWYPSQVPWPYPVPQTDILLFHNEPTEWVWLKGSAPLCFTAWGNVQESRPVTFLL